MAVNRMLQFALVLAIASVVYFGWRITARSAYESAEYTVLRSDGVFEIREYPALMIASTNADGNPQGEDQRFMRLFGYIQGRNHSQQELAMTTPVFMGTNEKKAQMGFVLPKSIGQSAPQPLDKRVRIRKRKAGKFAVIQFSGRIDKSTIANATRELMTWVQTQEWETVGDPESAGYDPPWTPGPLRRNEILVRVE